MDALDPASVTGMPATDGVVTAVPAPAAGLVAGERRRDIATASPPPPAGAGTAAVELNGR